MNELEIKKRLEQFEAVCRTKGIKLTHQRMEIYKNLLRQTGHPTVEEVYEQVRQSLPTISLDTVYRTITSFEDLGLIHRIQVHDNKCRIDTNVHPHHHLICTSCKKVTDFDWDIVANLDIPEELKQWGDIHTKHIEIKGLCRECSAG